MEILFGNDLPDMGRAFVEQCLVRLPCLAQQGFSCEFVIHGLPAGVLLISPPTEHVTRSFPPNSSAVRGR